MIIDIRKHNFKECYCAVLGARGAGVSLPSWSLPSAWVAAVDVTPSGPVSGVIVVAIKPAGQNENWDRGDRRACPHRGRGVRLLCDICGRPERWLMIRWRSPEGQREGAREPFRKRKQSLWILGSEEQLLRVMKRRSMSLEHRGRVRGMWCCQRETKGLVLKAARGGTTFSELHSA